MRLCTYNVHLWADARGRGNTGAVAALLRALDCDVACLNEVPAKGAQLERVARELGLHHAFGDASWLGNALLSRAPLRDVATYQIGVGYGEGRSALVATVDTPGGPLDVCCTHLDPSYEVTRTQQLGVLLRAVDERGNARHVVAGDFNALRLADYSSGAMARVRAQREAADREAPLGDVVAAMDARGYVDAFRLARAGGLAGYEAELARAVPTPDLPTCWAGTRIDYLWLSRALAETARVVRCHRVESAASDHVPVLLELTW